MTTSDLGRLAQLRADLRKLHELRTELRSTARRLSGPPMDGMPRGRGGVNRRTELYAAKLADLDKEIHKKDLAILREEIKVQQFISTIPTARMRLIIRHRIVDGMSWKQVAKAIGYTETPEGVRAMYLRFMREQGQNPM